MEEMEELEKSMVKRDGSIPIESGQPGCPNALHKMIQLSNLRTRLMWAIEDREFDKAKDLIDLYRIDPTVFRK